MASYEAAGFVRPIRYRPVMSETLGQRLKELRQARDLTQPMVATAAGISVSFLNDMEHGRTKPSLDTLVRLSVAFDLTATEILRGVPPYDGPG